MSGAPPALRWHLRWLTAGWVMVVATVLLSLTPNLPLRQGIAHLDKLEHALAFLVLMAWFGGLSARRAHPWIAAGLLGLGAAIELAQRAGGLRRGDLQDLVADAVGIALGWLIARHLSPRWFATAERLLAR